MTDASPSESRPDAQQPPSPSRSSSHSEERRPLIPTLIVDKSPLFRAGLEHILAASPFRVTASCSSLSELPDEPLGGRPSVLLISLYDEVPAVMQQLAHLGERGLHIVLLTERVHPEELVFALTAGVSGYFLKDDVSPDVLVKALELALLGEVVVISKGLTKAKEWMQLQAANNTAQTNNLHRVSNREQAILKLLVQGASNKHIARQLNIAEATVKVHIKGILRKLGVSNRTQAALWARDHGPAA
jgi:two-component system, NarL family, nitrate/nitrite response regulator NarL